MVRSRRPGTRGIDCLLYEDHADMRIMHGGCVVDTQCHASSWPRVYALIQVMQAARVDRRLGLNAVH